MGERPPIGTRWGDLSTEQRRALPVGTVLRHPEYDDDDIRFIGGRWVDPMGTPFWQVSIHPDRRILSYPEAP